MVSEFSKIIEEDKYHRKDCLKGKSLGMLMLWAWNKSYIFLNFDNGRRTILPIEGIEKKVKFLSKEEYDKIYRERNYPDEIFENHYEERHRANYFKGDKKLYTKRQQQYGLIHDNIIKHIDNMTNKLWTNDFCRAIAHMITNYHFYTMIIKDYGSEKEAQKDMGKFRELVYKYFMSSDDMYSEYCDKMSLNEPLMSEEEIIDYINKIKLMPKEYSKKILGSNLLKGKEFDYYLEKAENVNKNVV